MNLGECLAQIGDQLGKIPIQGRRAPDDDIIVVGPRLVWRNEPRCFLKSAPSPVAPNGPAALAPVRPVTSHGMARHGETEARRIRRFASGTRSRL